MHVDIAITFCMTQVFIFKNWMIFGNKAMGVYSQKIAKETYQKYSVVVQLFLKETKLGPGIK